MVNKTHEKAKSRFKIALKKSWKSLYQSFPILFVTVSLVSLLVLIPKSFYRHVFSGSFWDPIVGALLGSVSAGNPVTSYILGGEFIKQGVGLVAVTAFLIAWVTVGLIQLPAESAILGKRFAIVRNITAFFLAIISAFIVVFLMRL